MTPHTWKSWSSAATAAPCKGARHRLCCLAVALIGRDGSPTGMTALSSKQSILAWSLNLTAKCFSSLSWNWQNKTSSCEPLICRVWTANLISNRPEWCSALAVVGSLGQNWRRTHSLVGIGVPSGTRLEMVSTRSSTEIAKGRYNSVPCRRSWAAQVISLKYLAISAQKASNLVEPGLPFWQRMSYTMSTSSHNRTFSNRSSISDETRFSAALSSEQRYLNISLITHLSTFATSVNLFRKSAFIWRVAYTGSMLWIRATVLTVMSLPLSGTVFHTKCKLPL